MYKYPLISITKVSTTHFFFAKDLLVLWTSTKWNYFHPKINVIFKSQVMKHIYSNMTHVFSFSFSFLLFYHSFTLNSFRIFFKLHKYNLHHPYLQWTPTILVIYISTEANNDSHITIQKRQNNLKLIAFDRFVNT